jgi:hypothetical protein
MAPGSVKARAPTGVPSLGGRATGHIHYRDIDLGEGGSASA